MTSKLPVSLDILCLHKDYHCTMQNVNPEKNGFYQANKSTFANITICINFFQKQILNSMNPNAKSISYHPFQILMSFIILLQKYQQSNHSQLSLKKKSFKLPLRFQNKKNISNFLRKRDLRKPSEKQSKSEFFNLVIN